MEKYSPKQLETILESINKALQENLNKTERWCFLKNKSIIKNELDIFYNDLPEDDEEYIEYRKKLFNIWIEHGASYVVTDKGKVQITTFETMNDEDANIDIEVLNKEYKEVIEKQEKITEEKKNRLKEKVIEIEWFKIDFDQLENDTNSNILNENTIQLVK